MKHPALARVFGVVLAILAVLLLISGIRGFGKARDEHEDRLAYAEKFAGRIEQYQQLHRELSESADYTETMAALDRFLTEHEKAASQHKTDTAIFSASKGGIKMGEEMIVALRGQMNELRAELRDAKSRRSFLEGLLTELIASQKANMPWLDALANQAAQYAVSSYMESAKITMTTTKLRVLMENEPTPESVAASPFAIPEEPDALVFPTLPTLNGASFEAMQSAYQATMNQYMSAAAAYEQASAAYVRQMQDYYDASAQQAWDRFNRAQTNAQDLTIDAVNSAEYVLAHAAWEEECKSVKAELDFSEEKEDIQRLSASLTSIVRQANMLSAAVTGETGGIFPGLDELATLAASTAARLDRLSSTDLSALSNEEFLALADDTQELFDMLTDAFSVVASNLDNPAAMIADIMDKMNLTGSLVKYLDSMLEKANQEMEAQLAELWYQLGELEKDAIKLEAEKLGLDKEAALLSKRTLAADELKDLRNRHATARQLLVNVPEVKAGMETEEDLPDSARAWLDTYERETEKLHRGKRLINVLSVVGGVMGVLGILGSYELIRKRFMLLVPVLGCLVCAAGAEALNLTLDLGQLYVALFTAIFALIQLLIVLPKVKKPRYSPRH